MVEKYFGITDTGRVRENNEDTFIAQTVLNSKYLLACVIDGVGGYEGGEVAAAIARETILAKFMGSTGSANIQELLKQALLEANHAIFLEKFKNSQTQRMACVLTIAIVDRESNNLVYAHVGDTRLYLLRDNSLIKISHDHSFVGFLEDSNRLSESDAMSHPKRNEINKGLGFEEPIHDPNDYFEIGNSPFLPGDSILLCSDGLTDMINRETITAFLTSEISVEEKAKKLIRAANDAGGKDNITVVLVQNDKAPVKHKATRPVAAKKSVGNAGNVLLKSNDSGPAGGKQKKPANRLVIFLILFCLLLIATLIWLWRKDPTPAPVSNQTIPHTRNKYELKLADTLVSMQGNTLFLRDSIFSTSIMISDTLFINKDSVHILGMGSTVILSDTIQTAKPVIVLGAPVRYILFDSLTLRNIIIRVNAHKMDILHFKNVKMENTTVQAENAIHFSDSTYSGVPGQKELKKDTLPKR